MTYATSSGRASGAAKGGAVLRRDGRRVAPGPACASPSAVRRRAVAPPPMTARGRRVRDHEGQPLRRVLRVQRHHRRARLRGCPASAATIAADASVATPTRSPGAHAQRPPAGARRGSRARPAPRRSAAPSAILHRGRRPARAPRARRSAPTSVASRPSPRSFVAPGQQPRALRVRHHSRARERHVESAQARSRSTRSVLHHPRHGRLVPQVGAVLAPCWRSPPSISSVAKVRSNLVALVSTSATPVSWKSARRLSSERHLASPPCGARPSRRCGGSTSPGTAGCAPGSRSTFSSSTHLVERQVLVRVGVQHGGAHLAHQLAEGACRRAAARGWAPS